MPKWSRRELLGSAAIGISALATPALAKKTKKPPNILFIMADDLGYADLSCYGRRDYRTPNMDRLAEQGARFTSAYANSPVCSATRTALMTGRYQYRLPIGLEEPLTNRPVGLPPEHPTLPSLLRDAGYATALIGKWHLGALPKFGPLQSGYDHFWGFRGGGIDYFLHSFAGRHDLWDGDTETHQIGYLTDLIAGRAIETLRSFARNDRPFLMSLHFSAPHWPWEGPADRTISDQLSAAPDTQAMMHYDGGSMKIYAQMVTRLDYQIGRILGALRALGLEDDTMVVFTSDNGGERFSDTWPFSGRKTELLEGGIRIPAIVRFPGRIEKGREIDVPVMTMDWLPTLLSIAQTTPSSAFPSDGLDILPILKGDKPKARALFWRYKFSAQEACRLGNHKYLKIGANSFLFDVVEDPMERANLKDRMQELFNELKLAWDDWNKTMLPIDTESFTHGPSAADLADRFTR